MAGSPKNSTYTKKHCHIGFAVEPASKLETNMLSSCIRIAFSREAIIAFCLGLFFPVSALLLQISSAGYPWSVASIIPAHLDLRMHWMVDVAPAVMWAMGCVIAIYRHRALQQIKELEDDRKNTQLLLDSAADGILIVDGTGTIISGNRAALQMFGFSAEEFVGINLSVIRPEKYSEGMTEKLADAKAGGLEAYTVFEQEGVRKDGSCFPGEYSVSVAGDGSDAKLIIVVRDVSERIALEEKLNQAQKLESIGQLAAGIAHEINTPIQYVNDNIRTISEYLTDIRAIAEEYRKLMIALEQGGVLSEQVAALRALEKQLDLEFILDDAPNAMEQSLQGIQRVSEIVKAMKNFSHSGGGQVSMLDINASIQSTLTVTRNEYKYIADIETEFGELPLVECHAGELNQVFLNLIVNAAHAIEEKGDGRGLIRISTSVPEAGYVEIAIADDGKGIPESIRHKIFDPFFTTKEVGKGTGQGLNLAFQVIEQQHKGRIYLDSTEGKSTQFRLKIPEKMQHDQLESAQKYMQAIG